MGAVSSNIRSCRVRAMARKYHDVEQRSMGGSRRLPKDERADEHHRVLCSDSDLVLAHTIKQAFLPCSLLPSIPKSICCRECHGFLCDQSTEKEFYFCRRCRDVGLVTVVCAHCQGNEDDRCHKRRLWTPSWGEQRVVRRERLCDQADAKKHTNSLNVPQHCHYSSEASSQLGSPLRKQAASSSTSACSSPRPSPRSRVGSKQSSGTASSTY
ncbi:unnamed protein product [Effrenium voratum]|uniref:Uncharacterized protein n=1 Tax=Effrenium voratum TaxID=2562239 RepID=A0AA36MLZ9_9DINO|nr:unnamed protein product [Effrenium voratum]